MFKLNSPPTDKVAPITSNLNTKRPDQELMKNTNNFTPTYVNENKKRIHKSYSFFFSIRRQECASNVVRTTINHPLPPSSSSKANTDILDRQLFEKTNLDYIPGLDYDLGPVYIPSKAILMIICSRQLKIKKRSSDFLLAPLDKLPALDESAAAAKVRSDEKTQKEAETTAVDADIKKKKQTSSSRVVKPVVPHSSMFIFSTTNP